MSDHHPCATGLKILYGCLAGLALLAAGCAHTGDSADPGRAFTPVFTPLPPPFLTGPMAALLTNRNGYTAQLDAQTESLLERERSVSGQLLCRGSKLFFAPESDGGSKQKARGGTFNFIWDVASSSGYVLSEALQGYAPVGSSARATNVVASPSHDAPQKVGSYMCAPETVAVQLDTGSTVNFQVMRATDLPGCPVRLNAAAPAVPLTVTLSKIRTEPPPAELFALPDGFTKYTSPEAMSDEIAVRQHNLRRKNSGPMVPLEQLDTGPPRRY